MEDLIRYFLSPGGNLVWDVLLQALGIFFTVGILQRYFERQEEKRWRPARQDLYRRLFVHVGWLIRMLPSDMRTGGPEVERRFGYRSVGGRADPAFSQSIGRMKAERLTGVVEGLADNPTAFENFEDRLDEIIQPSTTILIAREPGLSGVLADLREWMYYFENILEGYREVRGSLAETDVAKQACKQLKEVIIEADRVRRWLAANAEGTGPTDRNRRK